MIKTLLVVDSGEEDFAGYGAEVVTFGQYLNDFPQQNEPKTRIINLCDTETYLSKGYYCSLLAEARSHIALPSVKTINELRFLSSESGSMLHFTGAVPELEVSDIPREHLVYVGKIDEPSLKKVAGKIFAQYPAPILKITLQDSAGKLSFNIKRWPLGALTSAQRVDFMVRLGEFIQTVWRTGAPQKRHRWEMAILVNPEEKNPPSDKEAIARFIKAAAKQGIHAEALSIDQLQNISHYDALFLRETTGIDHHTYRLALKAEKSGLVVMDDSASILRCCNKVFLHDAFSYQNVPSLRTEVITDRSDATLEQLEQQFSYPMVLKMPEGSFSNGVFKATTRSELVERLDRLFETSALVLAQEYLFTDYDWRIGVLNGRAIFACKYRMARNHWQIYNHNSKRYFSGGFETLPTFEVPKVVLDAAIKACKIIGNGLYGVDIKEVDGRAYVIEVNDNPSMDYKVEDAYLGDELYMQVMAEFCRRLELRGR